MIWKDLDPTTSDQRKHQQQPRSTHQKESMKASSCSNICPALPTIPVITAQSLCLTPNVCRAPRSQLRGEGVCPPGRPAFSFLRCHRWLGAEEPAGASGLDIYALLGDDRSLRKLPSSGLRNRKLVTCMAQWKEGASSVKLARMGHVCRSPGAEPGLWILTALTSNPSSTTPQGVPHSQGCEPVKIPKSKDQE